jgi:hypothetical protein
MIYSNYAFIKPPRAETKVPVTLLPFYEKRGWWAQAKKNGTNSVIFIAPDKQLITKTRHGDDHKAWSFSDASSSIFKRLPVRGWTVLNAELLHAKTPHIKDTHYLHDIFVLEGRNLMGLTYAERYKLLQQLFLHNPARSERSHYVLDNHTWLARNIRADEKFETFFNSLKNVEDEGLVLKNPTGMISSGAWTVKCRKTHSNYSF